MSDNSAEVLGQLTAEELSSLNRMRAQTEGLVYQLGLAELHKNRLMTSIRGLEDNTNGVLKVVGERLGISDSAYSITSKGEVVRQAVPAEE